jgi:hypothetical protein
VVRLALFHPWGVHRRCLIGNLGSTVAVGRDYMMLADLCLEYSRPRYSQQANPVSVQICGV